MLNSGCSAWSPGLPGQVTRLTRSLNRTWKCRTAKTQRTDDTCRDSYSVAPLHSTHDGVLSKLFAAFPSTCLNTDLACPPKFSTEQSRQMTPPIMLCVTFLLQFDELKGSGQVHVNVFFLAVIFSEMQTFFIC